MQCFACEKPHTSDLSCLSALPSCLWIGSAVHVLAELSHRVHCLRHEVGIGYRMPRAAAQGRSHQILAPIPTILPTSSLCEDELAIAIWSTAHRKHQHPGPLRDLSLNSPHTPAPQAPPPPQVAKALQPWLERTPSQLRCTLQLLEPSHPQAEKEVTTKD